MANAIFGYGSLILPYSVIARFEDDIPDISPTYQQRKLIGDDDLTLPEAREAWEDQYADQLTVHPVWTTGFIRTYTYESHRGGTMLEAYHTGRDEDILNGVLITGLTEEQIDGIQGTEEGYDTRTLSSDDFYSYLNQPVEIDNDITLYLGGQADESNWQTRLPRNPTYHARIIRGIEWLGEKYGEEVEREFLADFLNHTYEHPYASLGASL